MALTDESGVNTTMLVSPANNGGGFGGFDGNSGWWIILLFILLGGWGNGGWGNGGGIPMAVNTQNDVQRGFDQSAIMGGINGLQSSVCNGFSNVQQSLCNGFAGVNATVNAGFAAAEAANNARQIANMQTAFGAQTAVTSGLNDISMGLQNCCCENRASIADLKYTVATENCADRAALSDALREVIAANNASTQRILDQLCADKLQQKDDLISQLRSELQYARGQASQDVQTAAIQAGQRALANEVEQYVAPRAIPSYTVQNPNCCYNACGCGLS